jgi:hypothetical protein
VSRFRASIALIVCLAAASAASAGIRFDLAAQAPGYGYKARAAMDGKRLRLDIYEGNHPLFNSNISIISRKGGTEVLVIDHSSRTYFQRQVTHIAGPLPAARGMGRTELKSMDVDRSRETIVEGGAATERYTLTADYEIEMEIEGEKLRASVKMHAQFDIDPKIDQIAQPWGLQYGAKTGFDRLDRAILRAVPNRLPLRQVVTASRQIEGGPVITDTLTVDVTGVFEESIPNAEFFAPDGYAYREPVFSFQ